jgi:hypothetical protein
VQAVVLVGLILQPRARAAVAQEHEPQHHLQLFLAM